MDPKDELEEENSGLDDRLGVIDPDTYVESDWDEPDYDEDGLRALAEVPPDTSGIPEEEEWEAEVEAARKSSVDANS